MKNNPVLKCVKQDCIETSFSLDFGITNTMSDSEIDAMYNSISPMMRLRKNNSAKNLLVKQLGSLSESGAKNLLQEINK